MIKPEMQHGQTIQRQTWHEQQLQTVTPRTVGSETMHASSAGQVSHHLDPAGSTVTVRFAEQPSSRQAEVVVTRTVSHRNQAVSISSDLPARRSETSVVQSWEPCRPSKGRTATDGRWYNFSTPTFRFYAYSAWLDDRESILTDPVIRIISITTKLAEDDPGSQQTKGSSDVQLFCALTYDTGIRYVSMEPKPRPIGYGWPLNEEWVREYVYTCPIVDKLTPSSVSIVANAGDSVGSCMPVEISKKATPKKDFAVCALVASGNMDAYRVIEWMELHRLLGVTTVTVYTLDVDAQTVERLPSLRDGSVRGPAQDGLHRERIPAALPARYPGRQRLHVPQHAPVQPRDRGRLRRGHPTQAGHHVPEVNRPTAESILLEDRSSDPLHVPERLLLHGSTTGHLGVALPHFSPVSNPSPFEFSVRLRGQVDHRHPRVRRPTQSLLLERDDRICQTRSTGSGRYGDRGESEL